MRLRQFDPADLGQFTPRADFRADYVDAGSRLPFGPKLTLTGDDGQVLGVAGFVSLEPHSRNLRGAWAYMADMRPREWLQAARKARTACAWAAALLGARIYATPADTDAARRLLAFVGFRPSPDDAGVWKFMPSENL